MPLARFLTQLYEEALEIHGKVDNFASLLRCCCLNYLVRDFDHERLRAEPKAAA
jgi:predicted DNA-binding ribbon-helix-helix protein